MMSFWHLDAKHQWDAVGGGIMHLVREDQGEPGTNTKQVKDPKAPLTKGLDTHRKRNGCIARETDKACLTY